MPIKQIRTFSQDCTGDVCQGDEILFTEAVFGAYSRRGAAFLGTRRIAAIVIKDSYGAAKQQHTFTLKVLGSDGYNPIRRGTVIRRKGRNVYKNGTMRRVRDEAERAESLDDKHERGAQARAARAFRTGELS